MTDPRLKTEILVRAGIRYCDGRAISAMVRRRGDAESGALFVKVSQRDGTAAVFSRVQSPDGATAWWRSPETGWAPESIVEERLAREVAIDPDLWIVEVEDPDGANPFETLTGPAA
jgi:hypothetical protein